MRYFGQFFIFFAFLTCATLASVPGNIYQDGIVDVNDVILLSLHWLEPNELLAENIDGQGLVDFEDFAILSRFWLVQEPDINEMKFIPGGTFMMGDSFSEGLEYERPQHSVTLSSFSMSKYEITNQQYCDFLNSALGQGTITITSDIVHMAGSEFHRYCNTYQSSPDSQIDWNGSTFSVRTKSGRSMVYDPMVRVSWFGAAAYCNWRSEQEGLQPCYNLTTWDCDFSKNGYHLPTEAQWEYAARGGLAGRRYSWGDDIFQSQANYWGPTKPNFHPLWYDGDRFNTSPVGFFDGTLRYKSSYNWPGSETSYQTVSGGNGYGLYDMVGNVWEWCNDWYDPSYYDVSPSSNPTGPTTAVGEPQRVLRGGSWNNSASYNRVAYRNHYMQTGFFNHSGFRISQD